MTKLKSVCIAIAFVALSAASAPPRGDAAMATVLTSFDKDEHPDLRGVIVMRDGRIVAERYYNGETADTLHDIRSAGKSVTSLLVGIAIDRGRIHSVNDPLSAYWPEAKGSAIGATTIRDVLTMRSGLAAYDEDPASPGIEDKLDVAPDPLAFLLSVPRSDPPGLRYRYNSLTAYAAGVVVTKATVTTMADFARKSLFTPLGIKRWDWAADKAGYTKGQGNLSLTTRGFATIGEMVRGEGMYRGRRILSANWIRASLTPSPSPTTTPMPTGTAISGIRKRNRSTGNPSRYRLRPAMAATRSISSRAAIW